MEAYERAFVANKDYEDVVVMSRDPEEPNDQGDNYWESKEDRKASGGKGDKADVDGEPRNRSSDVDTDFNITIKTDEMV